MQERSCQSFKLHTSKQQANELITPTRYINLPKAVDWLDVAALRLLTQFAIT